MNQCSEDSPNSDRHSYEEMNFTEIGSAGLNPRYRWVSCRNCDSYKIIGDRSELPLSQVFVEEGGGEVILLLFVLGILALAGFFVLWLFGINPLSLW